jgi:hypothetical protein
MQSESNETQRGPSKEDTVHAQGSERGVKKEYDTPRLIIYGSLLETTFYASGSGSDNNNTRYSG